MDITATKLSLIRMILDIQNEKVLAKLKDFLRAEQPDEQLKPYPQPTEEPDLLTVAKEPTPEYINLDRLAREQGYDGKKLSDHIKSIDHTLWEDEDLQI